MSLEELTRAFPATPSHKALDILGARKIARERDFERRIIGRVVDEREEGTRRGKSRVYCSVCALAGLCHAGVYH